MTSFLVYNVEAASPSMIAALDRHNRYRKPDGVSDIDPARSHLNRVLVGSEAGIFASLKLLYDGGVKRPTGQAEKPYLRIVISASPEYFRPDDPSAAGTWDPDRLEAWLEATMAQLRAEHGDDLVHVDLHLDEDTPHIHAVVAPTYQKKPRRPGRQKRGETPEEFAARRAAAEAKTGDRVVGRASHPELSKPNSFKRLRERMAVALDHLGIEYGEDRHGQADAKTTRQWVKEQAAEIRKKQKELDAQAEVHAEQAAQLHLDQLALDQKASAVELRFTELKAKIETVTTRETEIKSRETSVVVKEKALLERETKINVREQKLDAMLETMRNLIGRVAGIVKTWSEDLGLTVPGPIETVGDLKAQLDKIQRDNQDRIAQLPPPDPDPSGPGF